MKLERAKWKEFSLVLRPKYQFESIDSKAVERYIADVLAAPLTFVCNKTKKPKEKD